MNSLLDDVQALAFPRFPGTEGERRAADFVAGRFAAAGALLLSVSAAGAQGYGGGNGYGAEPAIPLVIEGPTAVAELEPVLHLYNSNLTYHIPTPPPPQPNPGGFRAGPVSGGIDAVLATGETTGSALIGPRSAGSIYDPKQSADREIRRLIRDLE